MTLSLPAGNPLAGLEKNIAGVPALIDAALR
jgi:hypothetical protein